MALWFKKKLDRNDIKNKKNILSMIKKRQNNQSGIESIPLFVLTFPFI